MIFTINSYKKTLTSKEKKSKLKQKNKQTNKINNKKKYY